MKKLIIILILAILILNPVIAKTVEEELYEGNNIEVPGYNITLLVIGDNEKSLVSCINNEVHIIGKGNRKEIGNLKIEPLRIYKDYTKLQLTYSNEDECDESCSNNICSGVKPPEDNANESPQQNQEQQINNQQEENKEKNFPLKSTGLFLFVLILLVILIIKKR